MNTENENVDINMNKQVTIVLTAYGEEIIKNYYADLKCDKYTPDTKKELTLSLWELANIFGKYLYMGNTKIPFVDNKITMNMNN